MPQGGMNAPSTTLKAFQDLVCQSVTDAELLQLGTALGDRFIGTVTGRPQLDNIRTSQKFTLSNSFYGIRLAPNVAAGWKVNPKLGMDLFVTDRLGLLKNDVNGADSVDRVATARGCGHKVIAFFGGSTVMGVGARRPEYSIPAMVERVLRELHGTESVCVNYGIASNTSVESLILLLGQALREPPDQVVFYDGFNCSWLLAMVAALGHWDREPLEIPIFPGETIRHLEHDLVLARKFDFRYHARHAWRLAGNHALGALARRFPRTWVKRRAMRFANRHFRLWDQDRFSSAVGQISKRSTDQGDFTLDAVNEYWRIHDMANALCRSVGASFLTLLQPTVFWGNKPRTENEVQWAGDGTLTGNPRGFAEFYESISRATKRDYFVDMTNVFDDTPDEVFMDSVHLHPQGNLIVAQAIASLLQSRI